MVEEQFYQGLGSRRDEKSKRQGMKKLKALRKVGEKLASCDVKREEKRRRNLSA